MFTGLIEEIGEVRSLHPRGDGARLVVGARAILDGTVRTGDSISIDGACETVVAVDGESFTVEVIRETLARTRLGRLKTGDQVNLERALKVSDRIGGHLVQGHVDGLLEVMDVRPLAGSWRLRLSLHESGAPYIVEKGSVALDGVSLTVASRAQDSFEVEIIPHTWSHTTLGRRKPGDRVHVEWDLIAKYVRNMLGPHAGRVTVESLRRAGF
ncbi:MAG: Riboflavin synthase [Calditrichaeota bacterium]|nr:Riboflavin synthase [Calditrichota bacterium]